MSQYSSNAEMQEARRDMVADTIKSIEKMGERGRLIITSRPTFRLKGWEVVSEFLCDAIAHGVTRVRVLETILYLHDNSLRNDPWTRVVEDARRPWLFVRQEKSGPERVWPFMQYVHYSGFDRARWSPGTCHRYTLLHSATQCVLPKDKEVFAGVVWLPRREEGTVTYF